MLALSCAIVLLTDIKYRAKMTTHLEEEINLADHLYSLIPFEMAQVCYQTYIRQERKLGTGWAGQAKVSWAKSHEVGAPLSESSPTMTATHVLLSPCPW